MEEQRKSHLSDEDIQAIALAIAQQTQAAFYIEAEKHYSQHKRLDSLLDAYDSATSTFVKTFIGLLVVGLFVIAGIATTKGH